MTGLHDSCCAQICILLALTKAIDLKIHLSLTCEPTTSRQKHQFGTRISLPVTHQGSIKVSSKAKHLGCFEQTYYINKFKSRLHEIGCPENRVNKVLSEVKLEERKSALDSNSNNNTQEKYTFCHTIPLSGALCKEKRS